MVLPRQSLLRVLVLVLILGGAGCVEVDSGTRLAEEDVRHSLPTAEFEDVDLRHTDLGELTFHLTAPHFDRYDRDERAVFYGGVTIKFYEDGELSSTLTSEEGEVLRGGEELLAIGRVVVTTDTGTTILTPRLRWTKADKLVRSDTTVTIITDQDTLRGTGLIARDDLSMRRVLNPTGVSYRARGQGAGGLRLSAEEDSSGRTDPVPPDSLPLPAEPTLVGPDTLTPPPPPPAAPFGTTSDTTGGDGSSPTDSIGAVEGGGS